MPNKEITIRSFMKNAEYAIYCASSINRISDAAWEDLKKVLPSSGVVDSDLITTMYAQSNYGINQKVGETTITNEEWNLLANSYAISERNALIIRSKYIDDAESVKNVLTTLLYRLGAIDVQIECRNCHG